MRKKERLGITMNGLSSSGQATRKEDKYETLIQPGITAAVVFLATLAGVNVDKEWVKEFLVFFSTCLAFIINRSLNKFYRKHRKTAYKKYEGRWLQMIPALKERPYTILSFDFDETDGQYRVTGRNYYKDIDSDCVSFTAYRLVERWKENGFYYITDPDNKNTNGLGKLCFVHSSSDDLTRARGYFYDVSDEAFARKYDTIMVKCDEKLWARIRKNVSGSIQSIGDMTDEQIVKAAKNFADEQIEAYNKHHPENTTAIE